MSITVERLVAEIEADPARAIVALKAFEAATASAAKDRTAHINADIDTSSVQKAEQAFDRLAASAGKGGDSIRRSGVAASFAVGGWRTLAYTLNGVNFAKFYSIATLIPGVLSSIAAAAGGATAALLGLTGAIGPLTAGLGALGLGIGATVMGMGGIVDAYSAVTAPALGAAKATDVATQSNRSLVRSLEALKEARESLARAPHEAREAIQDARFDYERSLIDRRRALLGLVEAQRNLNNLQKQSAKATYTLSQETDYFTGKVYEVARVSATEAKKTAMSEVEARLNMRDAELSLLQARDAAGDSSRHLREIEAKGVRNSDLMVDARRTLRDAEWALADARRANAAAMTGETAGMVAARDAMAALTPEGRRFVLFLKDEFMPAWKEMRDAAQGGLLPGVQRGLRSFMRMFPMLIPHVRAFAGAVGDAFADFFRFWSKAGKQEDLSVMFTRLNQVLGNMLGVMVPLSETMVQFSTAAAPFANRILRGLTTRLETLAGWMDTVEGKKGMTEFFRMGNKFGGLWGDVIWNTAAALKEMVLAAEPLATWMLKSMSGYFRDLADSIGSVTGQEKLTGWFNSQKPAIREFTGLLKDLLNVFFTSGKGGEDSGFVRTMRSMRKNLVPAIGRLLTTLDESNFGPLFSDFVTHIIDGITWMVDHEGPLLKFISLLNDLGDAIKWMDNKTGGVSTNILGGLVMALGGLSILRRVGRWMRSLLFPITFLIRKLPKLSGILGVRPRGEGGHVGTGTGPVVVGTPAKPSGPKHRKPSRFGGLGKVARFGGLGFNAAIAGVGFLASATPEQKARAARSLAGSVGIGHADSGGFADAAKKFDAITSSAKKTGKTIEDSAKTGSDALKHLLTPALENTTGKTRKYTEGLGGNSRSARDATGKVKTLGTNYDTASQKADAARRQTDLLSASIRNIPKKKIIRIRVNTLYSEKFGTATPSEARAAGIDGDWSGGRQRRGVTRWVGEHGPELFTPSTSGTIHSATESASLLNGGGDGMSPSQIEAMLDRVIARAKAPVSIEQTFNEKIDPMHVGRELAWRLQ